VQLIARLSVDISVGPRRDTKRQLGIAGPLLIAVFVSCIGQNHTQPKRADFMAFTVARSMEPNGVLPVTCQAPADFSACWYRLRWGPAMTEKLTPDEPEIDEGKEDR